MAESKGHRGKVGALQPFTAVDATLTVQQMTMWALRLPLPIHIAFNGAAALGMALLGHPWLGLWLFAGASAFDALKEHLLARWLEHPHPDEAAGLRRVGLLSAGRIVAYTAPTFVMCAQGGRAELMFFGMQLATLLAVAMGAGSLSQRVWWGFATPMLIEVIAMTVLIFDPADAAGVGLNLAIMAIVAIVTAASAGRTIAAWHQAFINSIAERAAADAARETARQASRARANFLATMSHEIRTPMNGVLGMAQLLRRDERDPAQLGRLDVLVEQGEYLMSILNDILDVSKIDAGKLEIVPEPEELRPFLERTVGFWQPRADERGLSLTLRVAEDLPAVAEFDSLRVRQILFNLIGNALKFTRAGGVEVFAGVARREGERLRLSLAVRDTGAGISPETQAHLFERFTQGDESKTRRHVGTGLGLAIVRQLAELMGGRTWVESTPGQGSTFRIEIEVRALDDAAADPAILNALPAPAPEPDRPPTLRILAVDDKAVNLLVLEQLLAVAGHAIVKAESGAQALDILAGEPFDVVLADIQMPKMSGSDLLRRVRATPGPNQRVPVIALTADVMSGDRQAYLDEGFVDHASKPIQLKALVAAIEGAVAVSKDAREERAA